MATQHFATGGYVTPHQFLLGAYSSCSGIGYRNPTTGWRINFSDSFHQRRRCTTDRTFLRSRHPVPSTPTTTEAGKTPYHIYYCLSRCINDGCSGGSEANQQQNSSRLCGEIPFIFRYWSVPSHLSRLPVKNGCDSYRHIMAS